MDLKKGRQCLQWLRNIPPIFTLMMVVAFGILFYQFVKTFDLSAIHFSRIVAILEPFIIGLVITFFLVSPVKFLQTQLLCIPALKKRPALVNLLAIFISYVVIFGLLILVLVYIVPQVFSGLSTLLTLLIDALQYLYGNLDSLMSSWDESSWATLISGADLSAFLGGQLSALASNLQDIAAEALPKLGKTVASTVSGSLNVAVGIIISIYLVSDRQNASAGGKRVLYALLRRERADRVLALVQETLTIFRRFFVGKALDSLIIGILCYIFMKIFNLPYAELISVIVGITNIIPYFGPFIGAIPSILIIVMVSPMEALVFAIFILALQQLDGNVIGPAILGSSLGLKPIWIIFSVTVGGGLFGIVGMIVGVPAFTVIYTLWQRYLERKLEKRRAAEAELAASLNTAPPSNEHSK